MRRDRAPRWRDRARASRAGPPPHTPRRRTAPEVDALRGAREAAAETASDRLLDRAACAGLGHAAREDDVRLEPARPHPRRPRPAVELRRRLGQEIAELDLLERSVPLAVGRTPPRAAEDLRQPALDANAEHRTTTARLLHPPLCRLDEVEVVEVVLVVRRHRVWIERVVALGRRERGKEARRCIAA